jgi:hypothetical protein
MPVATKTEKTYFITPEGRLSYLNVFKPRKRQAGEEGKPDVYDGMIIMETPKKMSPMDLARYQKLKELCEKTRAEKWPKLTSAIQGPFRTTEGLNSKLFHSKPLDADKNPEYEGKLILKAVSYGRQPQLIGPDKEEIMEQSDLYSGCYGRFWVVAFAYENSGNKGISFSLQGVMKTKEGIPLGGSAGKALDAFAEIEGDDFETEEDEEDDLDL